MEHRRRLIPITAVAGTLAATVPTALAIAPGALADITSGNPQPQPQAHASVVRVASYRAPRRKVVHRHFHPWRHPTPSQVQSIIRSEARRWRVSPGALENRVFCESRYRWYAANGQYAGVLQMNWNAFARGLHTIRSYSFKIVRQSTHKVHDARITYYSDGTKKRRRTTPRRQRVVTVYTGRISRHPALNNAFAQIRIGAQALRGISGVHSSEWSCAA